MRPLRSLTVPPSLCFALVGAAAIACSSGSSSSGPSDASSADATPTDAARTDGSPTDAPSGSDGSITDAMVADAAPVDGGPCAIEVPDGDVCKTVCTLEGNDGGLTQAPCQTYCSLTSNECFLADGMPNYNCDYSGGSDGGGEVFC